MGDNVLKAIIDVSAPGAKETFNDVAKSAAAVNDSLKQLGNQGVLSVRSMTDALDQLKVIKAQSTDPADIQKLNIAIGALENKISEIPAGFEKIHEGTEKVHISSLRASSSALNLSHSLGLLPAESSHITHGLESIIFSFERLKEESGSSSLALKSLAGTIGAGIGLGLLITGLSALVEKLFSSEEELKNLEEQLDRVKDSIEGMNEALKSTGEDLDFLREMAKLRAEILGVKGATLDLVDLNAQKNKNQILKDQLQEDLTDISNKIKIGIDKVKTIANLHAIDIEFTKQGLIPESVIENTNKTIAAFFKTYNSFITEKNNLDKQLIKNNQETSEIDARITIAHNKQTEEANKKKLDDYGDYLKRQQELYEFQIGLLKILDRDAKILEKDLDQILKPKKADQLKISANIQLDTLATDFGEPFQKISKDVQTKVKALTETNQILIRANTKVELTADQKSLEKSLASINEEIAAAAADTFANIGDVLGKALAGGDIKSGLNAFVSIIGDAFQRIGRIMIESSAIIAALKKAISSLNPAILLPAGIALVAIGAALKQSISGIKGFAGGGQVQAGVPIIVGEKGQEIFVPDTGGRIIPNHQIARSGIAGSNGMNVNISVSGQLFGRGSDLYAIIQAEIRKQLRLT